jgi:hypothetical protein
MCAPTMLGKRLCLLAAAAAALPPTIAQSEEVVVRASAARPAIERILNADNLDLDRLSMREVADTMDQIPRGRAPLDFWLAYRAHVRAWQDYADARDRGRGASPTDIDRTPDGTAVSDARRRINTTFDEVEEIARRYGARLPAAPTRIGS